MSYEFKFKEILDDDEKVIWSGKPVFIPFIATGLKFILFGIIWGLLDYNFIQISKTASNFAESKNFLYLFMALHTFPCWGAVLYQIYLIFSYKNTFYLFSNKRVIKRSGLFGIDYVSIDYDKIVELLISINPIEKIFNVGTLSIDSGGTNRDGNKIYKRIVAIEKPYDVYKLIKTISVDIKTDWNYPNELRPEKNPGYKTSYEKNSTKE